MNTHDIKRYAVSGDIAYPIHEDPEGDYVTYEDHVAAIEADCKRRGEPVDESQRVYLHDEGRPEYLDGALCQYVIERGKPYPHGDPVAFVYEKEDAERIVAALNNEPCRGEPVAWQPIETAPHGEEVLLGWLEWGGAWKMEVSLASWGRRTKTASNISAHGQATHWMPLPDAPQPAEPSGASALHNADSGAQNGIQATQPAEPVKLECPKCGADRAKEPCAGNLMNCAFKGEAHVAEPVNVDHGETRANIGLKAKTGSDLGGVVDHGEAEPVKVPSDADAKHVRDFINCDGMGAVIVEGPQYSAVVRALLARYTTTKEQP